MHLSSPPNRSHHFCNVHTDCHIAAKSGNIKIWWVAQLLACFWWRPLNYDCSSRECLTCWVNKIGKHLIWRFSCKLLYSRGTKTNRLLNNKYTTHFGRCSPCGIIVKNILIWFLQHRVPSHPLSNGWQCDLGAAAHLSLPVTAAPPQRSRWEKREGWWCGNCKIKRDYSYAGLA